MKVSGPSKPNQEAFNKIPSVLWDGGEKSMSIHIEISGAGKLSANFVEHKPNGQPAREISAHEPLFAGTRDFTIAVPKRTGVYLQLDLPEAGPGASLNWRIGFDGKEIHQYSGTLHGALANGQTFNDSVDFPDVTANDPKRSSL